LVYTKIYNRILNIDIIMFTHLKDNILSRKIIIGSFFEIESAVYRQLILEVVFFISLKCKLLAYIGSLS